MKTYCKHINADILLGMIQSTKVSGQSDYINGANDAMKIVSSYIRDMPDLETIATWDQCRQFTDYIFYRCGYCHKWTDRQYEYCPRCGCKMEVLR